MAAIQICDGHKSKPAECTDHLVQFIPAKIGFDGEEKVQPYFTDVIRRNSSGDTYFAALRGRPLKGQKVPVPPGYAVHVLQTECSDKLREDEGMIRAHVVRTTDTITEWTYGDHSSDNEQQEETTLTQAISWLRMAKVLHQAEEKAE